MLMNFTSLEHPAPWKVPNDPEEATAVSIRELIVSSPKVPTEGRNEHHDVSGVVPGSSSRGLWADVPTYLDLCFIDVRRLLDISR